MTFQKCQVAKVKERLRNYSSTWEKKLLLLGSPYFPQPHPYPTPPHPTPTHTILMLCYWLRLGEMGYPLISDQVCVHALDPMVALWSGRKVYLLVGITH